MKKLFMIFLILLCLVGCNKIKMLSKKQTSILISENLNIEYMQTKYLYDLVDVENGSFISENHIIESSELGEKTISFKYNDSYNKEKNYEIKVNVVDTTKPLIFASKKYTIKTGEKIDLVGKAVCGDNYTREMKCNIEGTYNINKAGEYPIKFITTDESGNFNEKESKLIVKDTIANGSDSAVYLKSIVEGYKKDNTMVGVDVSTWQGNINWEKVKKAGIEFAIIRIGYGYDEGEMVIDKYFETNLKNAKKAGIPVGIYFYSYAKNTTEAKEQAKWIIKTLDGEKLDLPIAFDWEIWNKFMSYKINFHDLNDIATSFMDEIVKAGYNAMNYGSATYLEQIWDTPQYPTWLAYYTEINDFEKEFYIWQKTNLGKVDGINGYVDLNILYKN